MGDSVTYFGRLLESKDHRGALLGESINLQAEVHCGERIQCVLSATLCEEVGGDGVALDIPVSIDELQDLGLLLIKAAVFAQQSVPGYVREMQDLQRKLRERAGEV